MKLDFKDKFSSPKLGGVDENGLTKLNNRAHMKSLTSSVDSWRALSLSRSLSLSLTLNGRRTGAEFDRSRNSSNRRGCFS